MLLVRGWSKGEMDIYYLMGKEFQFCKMKKEEVLELDGSDNCTTR